MGSDESLALFLFYAKTVKTKQTLYILMDYERKNWRVCGSFRQRKHREPKLNMAGQLEKKTVLRRIFYFESENSL